MTTAERLKLVKPTMEYEKEIQAFRQEFIAGGGDMDGCLSLRRMERVGDWLKQVEDFSKEETCPAGYVPQTQFLYVRENDDKVIGVIQVRHRFNDFLEKYAGLIGYSVRHSERRKGYATKMLGAVLPLCWKLGFKEVLVCCLVGNEGSRRAILKNGGVYEYTVHEPMKDVNLERYWIRLN